jgi:hypothetical protein
VRAVFVGDRPSRLNKSPNIAFEGAACYPRLIKWIAKLELSDYRLKNSHTSDLIAEIKLFRESGFAIIALGKAASERLSAAQVHHFSLPHPSGLNRRINDQNYIEEALAEAYLYIRGFIK